MDGGRLYWAVMVLRFLSVTDLIQSVSPRGQAGENLTLGLVGMGVVKEPAPAFCCIDGLLRFAYDISIIGRLRIVICKFLLPVIFMALPAATLAATVTIDRDTRSGHSISEFGIRDDTATRGRDLVGMAVSVDYQDGTSEEVIWSEARRGGHADGSGFNLAFNWRLFELSVTKTIASLTMDAGAGSAVFDTISSRDEDQNTYGTKFGYEFYLSDGEHLMGNIDVSYWNRFSVAGHDNAPDAYTMMSIDFTGLEGGGLSENIQFNTDLDSLEVRGDLTPVPLPASLLMLASACGILGSSGIRKRILG